MTPGAAAQLQLVRVDSITPHPDNPRRDLGDLDGLAKSIKAVGILQALVLHDNEDGTITCLLGHRRRAASGVAGLEFVPASVWLGLDADEQLEIMLTENLQREDLKPMEEARAFEGLLRGGKSQRVVAERVGCDQSHVSRRLELLKLSEEDQERVDAGKLTVGKALKSLKPPKEKPAKPEPIEVPESLRPDPIEALEPIGYGLVCYDGDGIPGVGFMVGSADAAIAAAHTEEWVGSVPVALVPLPPVETISPPIANEGDSPEEPSAGSDGDGPADPVAALPPERTGPLVTISKAMGEYDQHLVQCVDHGRIGGFENLDAAYREAEGHALTEHPGENGIISESVAPVELVEEIAGDSEPSDERKAALVAFATTWATVNAADETTVRESAEHEFGELSPDANRAVNLWIKAREQMTSKAS